MTMDDDVNSLDSLPTSDEFEVIGHSLEPRLHIVGDVSEEQLQETLQEVIVDIGEKMLDLPVNKNHFAMKPNLTDDQTVENQEIDVDDVYVEIQHTGEKVNEKLKMPLQETISDSKLAIYTTSPSPLDEDLMSISTCLADGEYTVFDRIVYLGSAILADATREAEVRRSMAILNGQAVAQAMHVSLSLPLNSEGQVILYEPSSSNEIASFPILQITSHFPGNEETREASCFALVHGCKQGTVPESTVFQCHVFRCEVPEAVSKIMQCCGAASKKAPRQTLSYSESFTMEKINSEPALSKHNVYTHIFEASLEFKEDDSKGGYASCPKDKDYFKLRCKLEKSVIVTVQQVSDSKALSIERCFGLLLSPGRNVRNSDMQLIEMVPFNKPSVMEKPVYSVVGLWDPNDPIFEVLNTETPKDRRVYLTVAVDLVITGIQEPVRFVIETKAKILQQTERFWYVSKRALHEKFYLKLREVELDAGGDHTLQVLSLDSTTLMHRRKSALSLNLARTSSRSSLPSPASPADPESSSDNDEPLLSGTGDVSKDCTETELAGWAEALVRWRQDLTVRPRHLAPLVRRGVPEALRGEVWQLLAGCTDHRQTVDTYKALLNKVNSPLLFPVLKRCSQDSSCESIIQRDINRTFPAHEQFKEKGGIGQESLFKICKAYSIYDPEVGYCQGLSFLVAALLLHMPEEQAFGVLVKIMFDYHTRDMFRNGFEELHLKFYQLSKLMEEQLPELATHFADLGIEAHMFASQWFLTLFTAKFPLIVVFFIIDLFLLDGIDIIFQVALSLLKLSQKELLALDFEGVLKHFRVSLPKKYRTEDSSRILVHTAIKLKVKKLKKYQKEYLASKEQEREKEDPIIILKKENKLLLETNLHLDQENDDLMNELINTKLKLRNNLEKSEEKVDLLTKELQAAAAALLELEEEKKRLSLEVAQLKEMCRRELQKAETESARNSTIISEYKQIRSQLSTRLEREQAATKQNLELIKTKIETCLNCSKYLESFVPNLMSSKSSKDSSQDKDSRIQRAEKEARELELELARTKLALVESECKNQDLTHQLNTVATELQTSRTPWFQKTFSSIREAAKKELPSPKDS